MKVMNELEFINEFKRRNNDSFWNLKFVTFVSQKYIKNQAFGVDFISHKSLQGIMDSIQGCQPEPGFSFLLLLVLATIMISDSANYIFNTLDLDIKNYENIYYIKLD